MNGKNGFSMWQSNKSSEIIRTGAKIWQSLWGCFFIVFAYTISGFVYFLKLMRIVNWIENTKTNKESKKRAERFSV